MKNVSNLTCNQFPHKCSYCYLSSFLFAPLTAVNCHKSTLGLWRQLDSPKIQVRLRNDPPSSETVNHSSMNIERSTIYFTHLFEPNQIFYFCRLFPHFADLFWMPIVYFMNNQNWKIVKYKTDMFIYFSILT